MSCCFRLPFRAVAHAGVTLVVASWVFAGDGDQPRSAWVFPAADGRLEYKTTAAGDRIMDFSHAGYMGGGVALPDVPVAATVRPVGDADATRAIQSAIDAVAARPLANGFRGAVLLEPGVYACSGTITIPASGVVLRGSGSGDRARDGENVVTTIRMTGEPHLAIALRAADDRAPAAPLARTTVADAYVPAGTSSFAVADVAGFSVGDLIAILRPVTEAWVDFMHMDDLTRDGRPQTWIKAGSVVTIERVITAIAGNRLTLDVPMPDSLDARYLNPPGTIVEKRGPSGRVSQSGIESLHIESPPQEISHHEKHFTAVRIHGEDCWVQDVVIDETMNSVGTAGRRITLERVTIRREARHQGASRPMEFAPDAGQVLLDRCAVVGDNIWFVGTGARVPGPIVILNCDFRGHGRAESHQRWSTAILYDNCRVPGGGIEMRNRGSMGSGHGWAMGWGVIWNCDAPEFLVQNPPGALNWLIGGSGRNKGAARPFGTGPELPRGIEESPGRAVAPRSLYLTQLAERLGADALRRIGYASTDPESARESNPVAGQHIAPPGSVSNSGNLARNRPILATSVRGGGREHAAWLAIDDDDATYWTTEDGVTTVQLELDTEGPVEIDTAELGEARGLTGRIQGWRLEGFTADAWRLLAEGSTIGELATVPLAPVTIWKVRLSILRSDGSPTIRHLGVYRRNDK